jgi:O-Antigen ligase
MLSSIAIAITLLIFIPIAAGVTKGRKLLLAIIILNVPFRVGAHLFYSQDLADRGAQAGLDVSLSTVAVFFLYILWVIQYVANRRSRPPVPRVSLALLGYTAFAAISLFVARNRTLGLFELMSVVQAVLIYIYVTTWLRTRSDVLFVIRLLLVGLVLESILAIGLIFSGQELNVAGLKADVETDQTEVTHFPRIGGTAGSANSAAGYLVMCTIPAIAILLLDVGDRLKWLALAAFVLGGLALVLTFSRGGWLGFILALIVVVGSRSPHKRISFKFVMGVAVVLLLACVVFGNAIAGRLFESDEGAAYARIPLTQLAVRMIRDNPVFGVGLNNFSVRMEQYATRELSGEWLYSVHNKYLLAWSEMGIGGFLTLLWFLLSTIRMGWQSWKAQDRTLSPLALGFTAAILGVMIHMLFEVYRDPQYLWIGTAVIAAIWYQTHKPVLIEAPRDTMRAITHLVQPS